MHRWDQPKQEQLAHAAKQQQQPTGSTHKMIKQQTTNVELTYIQIHHLNSNATRKSNHNHTMIMHADVPERCATCQTFSKTTTEKQQIRPLKLDLQTLWRQSMLLSLQLLLMAHTKPLWTPPSNFSPTFAPSTLHVVVGLCNGSGLHGGTT